jgi:protein-L-isoaspartate(D-aspartate) O-methyltransferase
MGYKNVVVLEGDGNGGYPSAAPYNAIVVSAAARQVPPALVAQLTEKGRMIIPVGADDTQQLQLIRMEFGHPTVQFRELCRFVPLVSEFQS